jgi:hypothetical protein
MTQSQVVFESESSRSRQETRNYNHSIAELPRVDSNKSALSSCNSKQLTKTHLPIPPINQFDEPLPLLPKNTN